MSEKPLDLPDLADSELVRRYARGELSGALLQQFERRLLIDELLQDRVEAEFVLREHAGALALDTSSREVNRWPALAATLVVGLAVGALSATAWRAPGAAQQIETLSFTVARGATAVPRFRAPAGVPLAARFLTASDVPHRLEVRDRSGVLQAELNDLLPNADGDLTVLLPAFAAQASPLQIRLSGGARQDEFALDLIEP